MNLELVKFIPPDIRLEMAQKIIQESGIRPLAREIEIDPKSVYKYKEGDARPGDEVMSKLLALTKRDYPDIFDEYVSKVNDSFSDAMNSSVRPDEILPSGKEGVEKKSKSVGRGSTKSKPSANTEQAEAQEQSVDQKPTKGEKKKSVDQKPTKESESADTLEQGPAEKKEISKEISFDDLCDKIGVSNPFDRRKVEKIINSFKEERELTFSEIIELTGLSQDALEKYLEELSSADFVEETDSGSYRVIVKIMMEGD